jgi:transcriptional regulator with XRE-family HTH domain
MDDTSVIGARVRLWRAEQKPKLTQRKLARECGIDPTTLWRLEKGRTLPAADTLVKIAKRLGHSFDELTGSDRDDAPDPETADERELLDRVMETTATKLDRLSMLIAIREDRKAQAAAAARLAELPKLTAPASSPPPAAPKSRRRAHSA